MLDLPALYPIVDVRSSDPEELERVAALAQTLAAAGSTMLQLRAKPLETDTLTRFARRLTTALGAYDCRLIVNDRADVAAAAGAAGVHLGDRDLPVADARALLGADAIIGYSTHDPAEAAAPATYGANYLGFGPVFESPTKAGVRTARGVDLLAAACRVSGLPVVAIGGVTLSAAQQIWRSGAAAAAVISEIENSASPAELVRAYRESREAVRHSAG